MCRRLPLHLFCAASSSISHLSSSLIPNSVSLTIFLLIFFLSPFLYFVSFPLSSTYFPPPPLHPSPCPFFLTHHLSIPLVYLLSASPLLSLHLPCSPSPCLPAFVLSSRSSSLSFLSLSSHPSVSSPFFTHLLHILSFPLLHLVSTCPSSSPASFPQSSFLFHQHSFSCVSSV